MAKLLKLRRGDNTAHSSFTGAEGEVTVNTEKDTIVVHDGSTQGGFELARADLSNLPAGTIDNADINSSAAIANSKLATSGVTAGTYGSSSAIPAITVNDRGIVTSATTSAIDSTAITNGTSNVSVAASGDITVTRANSTKLKAVSNGIEVYGNANFTSPSNALHWPESANGNSRQWDIIGDQGSNGRLEIKYGGADGATPDEVAIRMDANGSVGLFQNNTLRLNTTSGGIDVTGTVTCDGLTCEGSATIISGNGVFFLQDSNNTGTGTQCYVSGRDQNNTEVWYVGQTSTGNSNLDLINTRTADLRFGTTNVTRAILQSDGHFRPATNNTYDLGTSSERWRNVYTNDLNLSNEGGANDVDGTWGNWTIQEGEDDLFLLNRRNGKKYKFNLSEVN
jgi:hypothetical protein